jgi:ElaB/YqjD/DUF883 family membrane-anchored ribosome-binding protein
LELAEQYYRQGATIRQAVQAAREETEIMHKKRKLQASKFTAGTTKNYEDLFIAIWSNAITDDIQEIAEQASEKAFRVAYKDYCLKVVSPLKKLHPEIKRARDKIHEQAKEMCKKLKPYIQEHVYKESQEWPGNGTVRKSPEYSFGIKQIEKSLIILAKKEMQKLRRSDAV